MNHPIRDGGHTLESGVCPGQGSSPKLVHQETQETLPIPTVPRKAQLRVAIPRTAQLVDRLNPWEWCSDSVELTWNLFLTRCPNPPYSLLTAIQYIRLTRHL